MAEREVRWTVSAHIRDAIRNLKKLQAETEKLSDSVEEQGDVVEDSNKKQAASTDKLSKSQKENTKQTNTMLDSMQDLIKAKREAARATGTQADATKDLTKTQREESQQNDKMLGSMRDLIKAKRDAAQATSIQDDTTKKLNVTQQIGLKNNDQFIASLQKLAREKRRQSQLTKVQSDALRNLSIAQDSNKRSTDQMLSSIQALIQAKRQASQASDVQARAIGAATKATNDLGTAQTRVVNSTTSFNSALSRSTSEVNKHNDSIRTTSSSHRSLASDVNASTRVLNLFSSAWSRLRAGGGNIFGRVRRELNDLRTDFQHTSTSMGLLQTAFSNFRLGGFFIAVQSIIQSRVASRLSLIGGAATIAADALGGLAGALGAVGTGLVGMAGSLGPVIGLLGVLPGLAVAATGAFGSLLGSLSGVGGALKAYDQQQKAASRTSGTAARKQVDDSRRIAQAERNLAAQRRASAKAIRDAERGIRDARERSARVQVDTARQIENAERGIVQAKERVMDAERDLVRAQKATTEARIDAARRLRDLERQTKSYALSEEGASLSLEESRKRLIEVMNDPGSTDLQRRQADLAVREAEARLEDIRHAAVEHEEELAEARQKGIEGSDQVVSALEREQDAHEAIQNAKEGVGDAEENLVRTREDASRAIRDANEAVQRAEEALAEAHLKAAEQLENSNAAMERTAQAAIPAAAAVDQFAEAMSNLSPEAQAVVWQLIRMRDGWNEVRLAAERAIAPGLLIFLQSVEKLFPTITNFVSEAGAEVGLFFSQFGRMMSSDSAISKWNEVMADAVEIIANWRIGLLNVAQLIGNIGVAAARSGLNDWLGEIMVGWTETWAAMTSGEEGIARVERFFEKTMERAELAGSVIWGMVEALYRIGVAGDEAGTRIWQSFDKSLDKFNEWSQTKEGFEAIKAVADASVPVFQQLGLLVIDLARGMGQIAVSGDAGSLIKQLRLEFLPVLFDVLDVLREHNLIGNFISAISSLGRSFIDTGLLGNLAEFINSVMYLIQYAVPAFAPAINVVIDALTWLNRQFGYIFQQMAEGTVIGKIWTGVFTALGLAIAGIGFSVLISRLRNFISDFRAGVSNVMRVAQRFVDYMRIALAPQQPQITSRGRYVKSKSELSMAMNERDRSRTAGPIAPSLDSSKAERDAYRSGIRVGKEYADGVRKGTRSEERKINNAGEDLGEELVDGTEDELKISSPSREGIRIGRNFGDAVADGARDEKRNARRAGDELGDALGDGADETTRRRGSRWRGIVGGAFRIGATAIAAVGAAGVALSASALTSYAAFEDVMLKSEQLFGTSSRYIREWAERTASSMGISQTEAINTANQFGNLFLVMGYGQEEAAKLSTELTYVAAGLAAANPGTTTIEAFNALEAAFNGDYTELQKLNPALGESAVLQKALELSGKNATSELTEQEIQAGLTALALGETETATQNLADKQDTLSGKIATTQGKWEDFKKKLGEELNTKLGPVHDDLNELLDDEQLVSDFAAALADLAGALVKVIDALRATNKYLKGGSTFEFLGIEFGEKTNVETEAAKMRARGEAKGKSEEQLHKEARDRVIARGESTEYYDARVAERDSEKASEDAKKKADQANQNRRPPSGRSGPAGSGSGAAPGSPGQARQQGITPLPTPAEAHADAKEVGEATRDGFDEGIGWKPLEDSWYARFIKWVKDLLGIQSPSTLFAEFGGFVVDGFLLGIANKAAEGYNAVRTWFNDNIVTPVKTFLGIESPSTVFSTFGAFVVDGFINGIRNKAGEIATFISTWFNDNVLTPVRTFLGIQSPSTVFFNYALEVINGFINGVISKANEAKGFIVSWFEQNIAQPIRQFFGIESPSTVLFQYALDVIQGFINGVTSKANEAKTFITTWFENNIATPIKDFFGIHSPSRLLNTYGIDVIQGFINGITGMQSRARSTIDTFVNSMGTAFAAIRSRFSRPTEFVVNTVYNDGIRPMWNAVAGLVNLPQLSRVNFSSSASTFSGGGSATMGQFAGGGYTGSGSKYQPAGVVHADEFVVKKSSRRRFEHDYPGVLDYINKKGALPAAPLYTGYRDGGQVSGESPGVSGTGLLYRGKEGLTKEGNLALPGGGTFPVLFSGWAAGGRTHPVPGYPVNWGRGYHGSDRGLDIPAPMGTPVVAMRNSTVRSTAKWGHSYGWHIRTSDGAIYAHLSRIDVSPGQQVAAGQRIGAVGSTGNALDVNTPVLTHNRGWTTHGDLAEGDQVYDENGRVVNVTHVAHWPDRPTYRITFGDGSVIDADENHLWAVHDFKETRRGNAGLVIKSTKEIAETYVYGVTKDYKRYSVPVAGGLERDDREYRIDPYALGVWLGDGHAANARVAVGCEELAEMQENLLEVGETFTTGPDNSGNFRLVLIGANVPDGEYNNRTGTNQHPEAFSVRLKGLGLIGNKRIPREYMEGSYSQRLALMQGLLDTDGYVDPRQGTIEFVQAGSHHKDLAYDVLELALSLGFKATLNEGDASIRGVRTSTKYRVCFTTDEPAFRLSRKAKAQAVVAATRTDRARCRISRRGIVKVERVDNRDTNCITVDGASHLYLAGESLIPTHNSTGPHLHIVGYDGSSPIGAAGEVGVLGTVMSAFGDMKSLITDPLSTMKDKFGDNQVTEALTRIPTKLADAAKALLDEKLTAITDYIPFLPGASGRVPGLSGVTANTYAKAANIYAAATGAGHRISTVGGYRTDYEHNTRRALDFMVGLGAAGKAAGDWISNYILSNRSQLDMMRIIWWQRINSGSGWRGMANRGSATQNHYDHVHVKWGRGDRALGGFAVGGYTGPGPKMQPAGIVHADEFVINKESRRRFEASHPGALNFINQTGQLPGYHKGGIVRTGDEGGTWWRKGTYSKTGKWIGALRHFLGLDDWWAGWDDSLDRAIRNYDGRPAAHVYGPWQGIMEAMRRLPFSEFTSAQNVASKIGIHPDTIFRMMDTNRAHFNRDLGDSAKNDALERSYAVFRDFHKESVEELQAVMGVEVTGFWSDEMRTLLEHIKHHVAGTNHPDNMPTAGGWSDVGSWGETYNELIRTIRLNAEWDRMIDQFFVWGYDSLIRHLEETGPAQGMELARDLYNVQQNARDADVFYREYYEREDSIKDEQSELNRLRRLVNYLRRYDDVGLQGLSSYLELTMDTTRMLYRKAKDRNMLQGISLSKTSRLDKDVLEFDNLFRFAMGGMVPGQGNIDSVLALLTPGEYVLTKEQTKQLMRAQNWVAQYQSPAMMSDISGMMSAVGGAMNIVNNVTNNVTATIVSPRPDLAGVAFQKHMSRLRDNGLFGMSEVED